MSTSTDTFLSLSARERIHRECCIFEEAWKSDKRPKIEEYLGGIRGAERLALVRELLGAELDFRFEKGENLGIEEYIKRFSRRKGLSNVVRDEFSQRSEASGERQPGDKIGPFEVLDVVGRGGLGIVHVAYDWKLERLVAIKVPRRQRVNDDKFFKEAQSAANLKHPSIVPIHHVDRDPDGIPYIVMEYCKGGSLGDRLGKEGCIDPRNAVEILQSVGEAVQFLHEHGYYHRDLKPGNILFDEQGKAYVADFGLAIHKGRLRERPRYCSGTFPYMAPELFRREIPDERADIWAMGVVLYEMLTGVQPFRTGSTNELIEKIKNAAPERLPLKGPPLPLRLVSACLKCLQKNRQERFAQVADLLKELTDWTPLEQWTHETTEDKLYVEPRQAVARLRQCLGDPNTRVLTLTGIGGLGKTAFLAHSFRGKADNLPRAICGIFYWSFAEEPQLDRFLKSLLRFGVTAQFFDEELDTDELLEELINLLKRIPLILILDGLEVHQQVPDEAESNGRARRKARRMEGDERLSRLLRASADFAPGSLVCLASRFPIHGLSGSREDHVYHFRSEDLRLTDTEGVTLLINCATMVQDHEKLVEASRKWNGYPLGLRFSALATRPMAQSNVASGGLERPFEPTDPSVLLEKIGTFYEGHLPKQQVTLLRLLSIFRRSVPLSVIKRLASDVSELSEELREFSMSTLSLELRALCDEEMATRLNVSDEEETYLCHPALRDHFNRSVCRQGVLGNLFRKPGRASYYAPIDYLAIQAAVIQTLLEMGNVAQADTVFRDQLKDGRLFRETEGGVEIGRACASEFIRDKERLQQCESHLPEQRVIRYFRMAGLFNLLAGDTIAAKKYFNEAHQHGLIDMEPEILLNPSLIWSLAGDPEEAESFANECLVIALKEQNIPAKQHSLACRAFSLFLQGKMEEARKDFKQAIDCTGNSALLNGTDAVLYAMFLLRVDTTDRARKIAEQLGASLESGSCSGADPTNLVYHHWLLGCIESREGDLQRALDSLHKAEHEAYKQDLHLVLPSILSVMADVYRKQMDWRKALEYSKKACLDAAEHDLQLIRVESLILGLRIRLERLVESLESPVEGHPNGLQSGSAFQARHIEDRVRSRYDSFDFEYLDITAEAEIALGQARQCCYRWLEWDALRLLADSESAASRRYQAAARMFQKEADLFRRDLLD